MRAIHSIAAASARPVVRVERLQLDHLCGAAAKHLDHHFAVVVFTTTRSPRRTARRLHDDDVAVAKGRLHEIAGNLQRIGVFVVDRGKPNLVPAADRKATFVEKAIRAGLREAEDGHRSHGPRAVADQPHEGVDRARPPRVPSRPFRSRASAPAVRGVRLDLLKVVGSRPARWQAPRPRGLCAPPAGQALAKSGRGSACGSGKRVSQSVEGLKRISLLGIITLISLLASVLQSKYQETDMLF